MDIGILLYNAISVVLKHKGCILAGSTVVPHNANPNPNPNPDVDVRG